MSAFFLGGEGVEEMLHCWYRVPFWWEKRESNSGSHFPHPSTKNRFFHDSSGLAPQRRRVFSRNTVGSQESVVSNSTLRPGHLSQKKGRFPTPTCYPHPKFFLGVFVFATLELTQAKGWKAVRWSLALHEHRLTMLCYGIFAVHCAHGTH